MSRIRARTSILAAAAMLIGSATLAKSQPYQGLTIQSGESWIFRIDNGQPIDARKVDAQAEPSKGELKVTLDPSMGTTMSVTNNSDLWYNYHAFMTAKAGTEGKRTSVCTLMGSGRGAFENWPQHVPAIRIANFTAAGEGEMICQ